MKDGRRDLEEVGFWVSFMAACSTLMSKPVSLLKVYCHSVAVKHVVVVSCALAALTFGFLA